MGIGKRKKTEAWFDGITCLYTSLLQWVLARGRKQRVGLMVLLVYIHLYYNGYWQEEENGGLV